MMGISGMEAMVIAGVALIVIGPKDLPAALRTLGRSIRAVRRMAGVFHSQFDQLVRDSEIDSMRRDVEDAFRGADEKWPQTAGRGRPDMPPAAGETVPPLARAGEPASRPAKECRS